MAKIPFFSGDSIEALRADHDRLRMEYNQLFAKVRALAQVFPEDRYARLWGFTLNEDISGGEASADLRAIDGTDTLKDVTVTDVNNKFQGLKNTCGGICLEQVDVDGTRVYAIIDVPMRQFCRFTCSTAFDTGDSSVNGTIVSSWGQGQAHPSSAASFLNHDIGGGRYQFYGASGDTGCACYEGTATTWRILWMEGGTRPARLWRFTLNADISGGTAAADLLELDGTDTGVDVTVTDVNGKFAGLKNTCYGLCIEQVDADGDLLYAIIDVPMKQHCQFTLDETLTTTDASASATIDEQWGQGQDQLRGFP